MPQPGFFDLDETCIKLDGLGDPLAKIADVVDWEDFRPALDRALTKPRKSAAGRKEFDRVLMFKVLVLQQMHNLSDDRTEFQIRDRHTVRRFLGLHSEDRVPDAKTIWRFRERLKTAGAVDDLFAALSERIEARGHRARKGQIVDGSFVKAPRQRNTREENAQASRARSRLRGRRAGGATRTWMRDGRRSAACRSAGARTTSAWIAPTASSASSR